MYKVYSDQLYIFFIRGYKKDFFCSVRNLFVFNRTDEIEKTLSVFFCNDKHKGDGGRRIDNRNTDSMDIISILPAGKIAHKAWKRTVLNQFH